ncbi:MAG: Hpt domain-containing protein [Phyllobacteriaceae bacterium]|nr:Hpt domain-containing protein [Phyllobacteriaceae bacterium]
MPRAAVDYPAFAKPGGEGAAPASVRPVDLVHLGRQTFGDRALEQEILGLFVTQILTARSRLRESGAEDRKVMAHGLKGSARSVGAFSLGDAAAVLELQPANALYVREIERRINDVVDFIASISR